MPDSFSVEQFNMATEAAAVFAKLQEKLTCGKCHDLYTNPKTLSCRHSFCQQCIEGIPAITSSSVRCPTCNQDTKLPKQTGAAGLFTSHVVEVFSQNYEEMKRLSGEVQCENCSISIATAYCKDCHRCLCRECNDMHKKWLPFSGHGTLWLNEVQMPTSQMGIKVVSRIEAILSETELKEQAESAKEEIRKYVQNVMLSVQEKLISEVEEVIQENNGENAGIHFVKGSNVSDITCHVGNVMSSASIAGCTIKDIATIKHVNLLGGKAISFLLSIELPNSNGPLLISPTSFSLSIVPMEPHQVINASLSPTDKPGVFEVTCTPVVRGSHVVNVQIAGVSFRKSSSLIIPFNPYSDVAHVTPVRTIYGIERSCGVAVHDDGHIVVSEYSPDIVSVLSKEGKKVKSFGKGANNITFSYNHGVAITEDGYILVADANNHKIQKISMDGSHIKSVGKSGSGTQEFKYPTGVAVSPVKNRIYVADSNNHRVQVLNDDLTFCRTFGKEGTSNGEFKVPQDVAIDSQGFVYVTDYNNHRIQKFNPDGMYMSQFGSKGSGLGQLNLPAGITADNAGLVYVTEYGNNRVSVFTSEGVFVRCFGEYGANEDQFNKPHVGIAFDKDGFLYICDYGNKRLVVY